MAAVHRLFFGQDGLRAGWRLAIFIALMFSVTAGGNSLIAHVLPGVRGDTLFVLREIMDVVIVIFVTWLMGRAEHRTLADYGFPWRQAFRGRFWQGVLFGLVTAAVLVAALWLSRVFQYGTIGLHGTDAVKWALIWGVLFVIVALKEELRARGYGLYTLARGVGFWPAAVIWAVYFGYSHHSNAGETWLGLLNVGLYAIVASILLRWTGNLWLPIGFHMAFDWSETYLYGVADSGHVLPGHLLNSSSSGPAWLSGGTDGPEGSILCTLLLVVLASLVLRGRASAARN